MSQRGVDTGRHRRGGAQRRGNGEASERGSATTIRPPVTTREGQGQQPTSFLQSTTGSEEREVALRQRHESAPTPEAGPERAGSTSRNAAVIKNVEKVMLSASHSDQPEQDNTYKKDISDEDVGGDHGSVDQGNVFRPWEEKNQPSKLNLQPHVNSGPTKYPTHGATHGGDGSLAPGDAQAPQDIENQSSNPDVQSTHLSALTEYMDRTATQQNNPAYECQYILGNISRVQDEISRNRAQIDKLRSERPNSSSIVSWMKNRLDNAKVDSIHQDLPRAFIPCTRLYAIMDEYAVQRVLEEIGLYDQTPSNQTQIEWSARIIAPPISDLAKEKERASQYRRVLAVLVMIGKADRISDFTLHEVDDAHMCDRTVTFELPEGEDEKERDSAYAKFPGPCQNSTSWPRQDIRDFREKRWEVSPPFFPVYRPQGGDKTSGTSQPRKQKPGIIHYELRSSDVILPFLREKREPATNGASSQLEFYRLHEDQHEGRRYTVHGKKHAIAVKRLEDKRSSNHPRDFTKSFQSERYVLQRLTLVNKSEHLIKLLATFEIPGGNCPTKYHFVFEAADGTVATLWSHPSVWEAGSAALSRWVARQYHGLAEALSQFHEFQGDEDDGDPKTRGMHGDIKPENILWYRNWAVAGGVRAGEAALGILQIADFGLSGFHSTGTVFDVKIVSTNDYTAPETERWLCHPPASDVWALGCLFLDLATWLVDGPRACAEFAEARMSRGPLYEGRRRFSTFQQVEPNSVAVTLGPRVIEHAEKLHGSRRSSQFVRDLIALVLDRMLVVEDLQSVTRRSHEHQNGVPGRISSGDVRARLHAMLKKGRANPGYHSPSRAASEFTRLDTPVLRFPVTAERMREEILATHAMVRAGMAREGN